MVRDACIIFVGEAIKYLFKKSKIWHNYVMVICRGHNKENYNKYSGTGSLYNTVSVKGRGPVCMGSRWTLKSLVVHLWLWLCCSPRVCFCIWVSCACTWWWLRTEGNRNGGYLLVIWPEGEKKYQFQGIIGFIFWRKALYGLAYWDSCEGRDGVIIWGKIMWSVFG